MLFTCRHQFSWPRRAEDGGYYQVCLHCGIEYGYDWSAMRRIAPRDGNDAAGQNHKHAPSTAVKRPPGKCVRKSWQPRERRLRLQTPVLYRQTGKPEWQHGVAENISRSGLLFQSESSVDNGAFVEMIFSMPAEICGEQDSNVLCRGAVVRTESGKRGTLIAVAITGYEFLPEGKVAGL